MKRLQRQKKNGAGPVPAADPGYAPEPRVAEAAPGQDRFDDVLPNLLLDVREAFLTGFRPVFRQFGVTDQQFRVLSVLYSSGDLEISKLARRCRIIGPSMTGILDRMVALGWVARKPLKGQRWGAISLATSGRNLIQQLQPHADKRTAAFSAAMGTTQLAVLVELLVKARDTASKLEVPSTELPSGRRKGALRSRKVGRKPRAQTRRSGKRK
jgi:homoprotocatechuate degradation regulator HpaR